jgi:ABC-type branched-subunit amino acid transport system permease subunit
MNTYLRNGTRAGATFGITLIFLVLIAFNVTVATLIGDLLKSKASTTGGLTPDMRNMMIFFGLIGVWAGASGARRTEKDRWAGALVSGLSAGLVNGLLVAMLAYLIGVLTANGVKITTYLPLLLPASVNELLLGQSPLQGALTHLWFLTVMGVVGGLLARGIGRGSWRLRFAAFWSARQAAADKIPAVQWIKRNPAANYVLYGLLVIFVFLMPQWIGSYWNYTMGTVGIYVLLGLGLNIVVGLAGLLDLGYVAFFAIGAYAMALLTAPQPHNLLWSFWLALPIGIVLAALAGILLGIPVLRMRGDYLAIVTLGFGEIIRILSKSDLLSSFSGGPKGVASVGGPTLFGLPFGSDKDFVYLILLGVMLIIFVTMRLQDSRVGRAWVAMREDETVAQAMGINTLRMKLLAFSIGAAFAGLGGALFASRNQFTGPEDFNLMVSINVLCVVIVGGMGSIPGVIAGALALKGLPEVLRELQNYRLLAFGALLVVMMILRPEGLIPSKRRSLEVRPEEITEEEEEAPPAGETGKSGAVPAPEPGFSANISDSRGAP